MQHASNSIGQDTDFLYCNSDLRSDGPLRQSRIVNPPSRRTRECGYR